MAQNYKSRGGVYTNDMQEKLDTVIVEFDEESGIGTVTMNRPDSLNALSGELSRDISAGLRLLEEQNEKAQGVSLRIVIVKGAGGNFCAGADISGFGDEQYGESSDRSQMALIRDFPTPVIAQIDGYCLGGGLELAMSCDFRFAHTDAQLGLPEIDLGLIPGAGGVQLISYLANPSIALEIAMTGNHISSEYAKELHIINEVFADDLADNVWEFAEDLANKPPLAIQTLKKSARMAPQVGLNEGIEYDASIFTPLFETEDHQKGVRAFAEDDYEPTFEGK